MSGAAGKREVVKFDPVIVDAHMMCRYASWRALKLQKLWRNANLGGRFGYFVLFFCSGRGGRGEAEVPGGRGDLLKSQERGGGVLPDGRARGAGKCLRRIVEFWGGGGGLNFFWGPKCPPSNTAELDEITNSCWCWPEGIRSICFVNLGPYEFRRSDVSGLKKTRPLRFLLLESVVLDWFMVISCFSESRWSFTCQYLAVSARNRAKTTKLKNDVLETPVVLMPECVPYKVADCQNKGVSRGR